MSEEVRDIKVIIAPISARNAILSHFIVFTPDVRGVLRHLIKSDGASYTGFTVQSEEEARTLTYWVENIASIFTLKDLIAPTNSGLLLSFLDVRSTLAWYPTVDEREVVLHGGQGNSRSDTTTSKQSEELGSGEHSSFIEEDEGITYE